MTAEDRGLALWRAVEDAARRWPERPDVVGVGEAGGHVVVIRVHEIDPSIFSEPVDYLRIG